MRRSLLFAFGSLAIALAILPGCRKAAGGKCKGSESTCLDNDTALACQKEAFVEIECAGPAACHNYQDHANCDDSVAKVGDPCMPGGDDHYACTPDKARALTCKNGKYERYLECRGKAGCSMLGQRVSCDLSVANKGDPCTTQGALACTEDQKQMVQCRQGKFEAHRYCRGQFGCYRKDDAPACDETLSVEGDPCGLAGLVVCSVDGKSELTCQGGAFVQSRACRKSGCVVSTRPGRPVDCQ